MIRSLVSYALNNRFIVLALTVLLLVWGAISFHNLPVEGKRPILTLYTKCE